MFPSMTSTGVKGACLACRAKKVRCIPGPTQRCERCTALEIRDCVYKEIKKRGIGKTLRMGEACKRCRARKKKCDGGRPCTTCVEANSTSECEYEVARTRSCPSGHPQFSFWNESVPSSSREVTLKFPIKTPVAIMTQPAPEGVPLARALVRPLSSSSLLPDIPPEPRPRTPDEVRTHDPPRVTLPPFSVLSTFLSPTIPPQPRITLSGLGAERFQLSDAFGGELDMKFRLRVVCRLNKLGIRFIPEKQHALLHGDTSGTVLNPFFICAAQSLGMYFCEDVDNSSAMIRLQARYIQVSLELLTKIFEGHDWELRAQAALWVAAGSVIMRLDYLTHPYIKKSCEAVTAAGLRFIPAYGRPPPLSADLHEKLSVLSQVIYFENFLFLTCGGAEPTMTTKIETEFRHQLQVVYPVLFKICPLAMRTQTILLVRDTVIVLNLRPTEEIQLDFWRRSCEHLVAQLDSYVRNLLLNLRRFRELGDKGGAGIIRSCCVNCLAHLAVLCETLRRMGPVPGTELDTLCDSALERLGGVTGDMRTEEYTRLDLLLGLSWEKALEVFDDRLANATLEQGERLRGWRETVAEVYSVFVAKLPDAGPATLSSRANQLDGRTEGSRYPNLMLPWVRQRYGI